jgi:hypothetical protein
MMKKWVSLFLGFVFIFAFSACDKENVGDDRETGPFVVWSNDCTDFEEFQTFFVEELQQRHSIKMVTLDFSECGYERTEYVFQGGVINLETKEELDKQPTSLYEFRFDLENVEQEIWNSGAYYSYCIVGETYIFEENIDIQNVQCVYSTNQQRRDYDELNDNMIRKTYDVMILDKTIMTFTIKVSPYYDELRQQEIFNETLETVQQNFVLL